MQESRIYADTTFFVVLTEILFIKQESRIYTKFELISLITQQSFKFSR